jgi:hypothetical protein
MAAIYSWLDLYGRISGVLAEQGTSVVQTGPGEGRFGAKELVARKSSIRALAGGQKNRWPTQRC